MPNYTDGFLRRPRLWEGHGRRASWSELFFDLILVAAVAQVGEPLRHDYSFHGLVRYAFLFGLIWWAWNGHTYFHSRFNCDDGLNSVLAVLQTFIAAGVPGAERMATRSAAGYSVAALIWIGSAFLAPPLRYAGWGAGALLEALTYGAAHRGDAAVPPDSHHFPERHGLFTIILFGELIAAIMHGIQGQESWSAGAASAAIAGLGFGFLLRSWYFDGAGGACERLVEDAKQRRLFQVWNCAHLPLFLGIGIAGIGLQKLINTDPSVRLNGAEMALLTCSVSVVTMMLVLIQAAGERGSQGGGWLITAQIASALALPFASDELARLPLVGAALYFVIYCAAQAAGLHEPRRPSVRSPGSRKWQRRRKAGAGVHGPAFPRQAAITLPVAASRAHAMIRIPSSIARAT